MSSNHYPTDLDSAATDSVASTPRSDHHRFPDDAAPLPRVRFMCSFGGKILPRPHDNQLRYVGGETRIVAVNRHTSFQSLLHKLSKLSGTANVTVKYQLPNEDLDALITVATDDDVENMMEEYDRLAHDQKAARLRLFLFSNDGDSRARSLGSLLSGSIKREHWFLGALNGGSGLERGRSEASSIVSEVPDYLFGLDNTDDPPRDSKVKSNNFLGETGSDPGSPTPVASSPFSSTFSSLAPPIPDLPPVKTKPDNPDPTETHFLTSTGTVEQPMMIPQQTGYMGNPMWQYVSDPLYPGQPIQHMPVYCIPGHASPGNVPIQQYASQFPPPPGQVPMRFTQPGMGTGQVSHPLYYVGGGLTYPGMVVSGSDQDLEGTGSEMKVGRVAHP